jgi:TPR repeat protein
MFAPTGWGVLNENLAFRCVLFALFACFSSVGNASTCEKAWDGDKIASAIEGRALSLRVPLRHKEQHIDEVTVAQIKAFTDAKSRISSAAGRSPIFVICTGEPNAFATSGPKGDVVGVTVSMVKLVDGDADMAAAIMGHELAHHTRNHQVLSRERDVVLGVLSLIAGIALESNLVRRTGVVSGLGVDLSQMAGTLVSSKFDRDQEREADEHGFRYMLDAGYNPAGAVRLALKMNRLGLGGAGLFFDRHPGWAERSGRFQHLIASSPQAQQVIARANEQISLAAVQPPQTEKTEIDIPTVYAASDAEKSHSDGLAALRSRDIPAAVLAFRAAAEAGYAPSQVIVGDLYANGRGGLPRNDEEAVRLFKLAAEQEDGNGQASLGFMFSAGRGGLPRNDHEAVRLYKLSAAQDSAAGLSNLGAAYERGMGGLPQDEVEAVRLYLLASEKGWAQAQSNLGFMYLSGKGGLAKNAPEAVRLFRLAANKNNALGLNNLGYMYENGLGGLPKSLEEAVTLYRRAASQGHAMAQRNLIRLGRM